MREPLNSDPEIQAEIDAAIAEVRLVEKHYEAQYIAMQAERPRSYQEQEGNAELLRRLRDEWRRAQEPFERRIAELTASSRRDGITFLRPIMPDDVERIKAALASRVAATSRPCVSHQRWA